MTAELLATSRRRMDDPWTQVHIARAPVSSPGDRAQRPLAVLGAPAAPSSAGLIPRPIMPGGLLAAAIRRMDDPWSQVRIARAPVASPFTGDRAKRPLAVSDAPAASPGAGLIPRPAPPRKKPRFPAQASPWGTSGPPNSAATILAACQAIVARDPQVCVSVMRLSRTGQRQM